MNDWKLIPGEMDRRKLRALSNHRDAIKPLRVANAEVYLSPTNVELFSFDDDYLRHLEAQDAATVDHFVSYFTHLLRIKFRARKLHRDEIDDLTQETFVRVMRAIDRREIKQANRLGSFVNSVGTNVLNEHYHHINRDSRNVGVESVEVPDPQGDLEVSMLRREDQETVREVLRKLPEKDQAILRARFMDETDKDEICGQFRVKRGYLRVLVHRASHSFKVQYRPRKIKKKAVGS